MMVCFERKRARFWQDSEAGNVLENRSAHRKSWHGLTTVQIHEHNSMQRSVRLQSIVQDHPHINVRNGSLSANKHWSSHGTFLEFAGRQIHSKFLRWACTSDFSSI